MTSELNRSPKLFAKENVERKLEILDRFQVIGYPALVADIIPSVKNENHIIRDKVMQTILILFNRVKSKQVLYSSLKNGNISQQDIDFYVKNFTGESLNVLLAIASLNHNGYIREYAVTQLAKLENRFIVPFLIFRMGDWVKQVRQAATMAYYNLLRSENLLLIAQNIDIIKWLLRVERVDLSQEYNRTKKFLLQDNLELLIQEFSKIPEKQRVIITQEITLQPVIQNDVAKLLARDKNYLVRMLVAKNLSRWNFQDSIVDKLLNDKVGKVRIEMLYALKKIEKVGANDFQPYLTDTFASIRNLARFECKSIISDYRQYYLDNLEKGNSIVSCILGIGEVGKPEDAEHLMAFLNLTDLKVRKAGVISIMKLNPSILEDYLLKFLSVSNRSLRKMSIEYFSKHRSEQAIQKAREIYQSGNVELRAAIITFFAKIGGYSVLGDLIQATTDSDEKVRNMAWTFLQKWKDQSIRLYGNPDQDDQDRTVKNYLLASEKNKNLPHYQNKLWEELPFFGRFEADIK